MSVIDDNSAVRQSYCGIAVMRQRDEGDKGRSILDELFVYKGNDSRRCLTI